MSAQPSADLRARVRIALQDDFLRSAVRFTVDRLRAGKARGTSALGDWEAWRARAQEIRQHTIRHLDHYLAEFARNATAAGASVHFAADATEACGTALSLARATGAKLVVKSKSMVSEEIELNRRFAASGFEVVETDLGEWIVQLAGETPSHLILPAIHKQRRQIQQLFEQEGGAGLTPETGVLAGYARRRLREMFGRAELGITGCNFAIAETGSVVLFTNEGNGRMVTTLPQVHIVLMGMERIVPTWDALEVMANVLPRSATGQKLTTYLNILTGPRRDGEADGARAMHIIVLDNGRSSLLGDTHFEDVLSCIRCGACLNVCPVYRHIGGHAYGSVYSGPIGAVLTPLLVRSEALAELANASTLCGACFEACPVKIPLHDMLVQLRRRNVERGLAPAAERLGIRAFTRVATTPPLWRVARFLTRVLQAVAGTPLRRRWLSRLIPALGAWLAGRALPVPVSAPASATKSAALEDPLEPARRRKE
jgi:L-lactate dehydrogenase complex protein LldF